ncbi:hydantoinase/carbamoylase family amidase [Lentilactobacillus hilgardii]|uniref:hydantoinase/carbamoylase family amidase n=1 Tax=Lentilactobacillus hilgardii TaxID=1588 RepID=UPI003FA52799
MPIKTDQLNNRLTTINQFSKNEVGQNRLVYSPNWVKGQKQLISWGNQAEMTITVDTYGTVYLDVIGSQSPDTIIATGSHMDTVAHGGPYDGLYGVVGGLQAILNLVRTFGQPKKTLRLISFSEEEGSRFPATFSGSKHYARIQNVTGIKDQSGIAFDTARQKAVFQLKEAADEMGLPNIPSTFTELHIEQGPRLIESHCQIGLVTSIVGQRRFTVTVNGIANHAGTTPMTDRHDALQIAIVLISHLKAIAAEISPQLTFTVGECHVWPNTSNVIPGKVIFSIDTRHVSDATLNLFENRLRDEAQKASNSPVSITVNRWVADHPTQLDNGMLTRNKQLAKNLGISYQTLASGAGHDSEIMSKVTKTTMIFVPSIDGISHAPQENTSDTDLHTGVKLLQESLREQAY